MPPPSAQLSSPVFLRPLAEARREPAAAAKQLRIFHERLLHAYGPQQWWPARTPFEVIIGAYLVQNTSWKGVVRSIANLEAHDALHPAGLRALSLDQLRLLIRPSGYMVRKAAALQAFVAFLYDRHSDSLEDLATEPTADLREQLLALPGVGPETADAILLYALGHPVMVVDEYLRRILTRHQLTPAKAKYNELQQLATAAFDTDPAATRWQHFNEFHALIVEAGKNHCGPTPRCAGCPLETLMSASTAPRPNNLVSIHKTF
jgi:endonuclease III related protein